MLVGMTKVVSLSVAIGWKVRTGVCELVTDGIVGIGIVAELLVDVRLAVAETLTDAGAEGDTDGDSDVERVAEGATDKDSEAEDPVPEADADADTDTDADGTNEAVSVAEAETVALLKTEPEEV
jgi:hypothetical protein